VTAATDTTPAQAPQPRVEMCRMPGCTSPVERRGRGTPPVTCVAHRTPYRYYMKRQAYKHRPARTAPTLYDVSVVHDPTGDFRGKLECFNQTLRMGHFPLGMIVASAGRHYIVTATERPAQTVKMLNKQWQGKH
jgi:hypothetical protein